MSDSRIHVVFFDAAETLFHVQGSVAEIYLQYAERHGFRKTPESLSAIKAAFGRAFREAPPPVFAAMEPAAIKQSERLWWFDIVHNVFYRVGMFDKFDEFFEEVFAAFEQPDAWRLYPETEDVLKFLKEQGYELGIISNFDSRLFSLLRGLGIADYFDTITISSLAHAAKPSARIFQQALEKHVVDPEEALHVGDSERDDVKGAQAVGLTGVLLARGTPPSPSSGPIITNLTELVPLLSGLK
ncbi:HAD family hydrolase [Nitrospirales bacterium NOB]|nr:MAG: haloacid dehalogenase, subfamily IA [Nitrospira sp. OLB3]MBV6469912.1 Phosphoglycolate phosphatase [Nitrospirota bacterium]MCE7964520.1 HAD family hydrolase [Nitrospira sp. NTP2]MCK6492455.1 HAD-IA family hydrolase [Nitrospira sp.]MDL1890727.1 HAD family hydrolase [Nitrospirales bacterium NOB]MEB2339718.1 HAD-IA family hydrolase [Nitrospirales bacterium]